MKQRIGLGTDRHRLIEEGKLILAGVVVSTSMGCAAHSDGDVLVHAFMDALLGAAGLGDIGEHFPDTDTQYQNADSMVLLKKTYEKIQAAGFYLGNADLTVHLEEPKLGKFKQEMRENLARTLNIERSQINIKAKTGEKLGSVGQGEAIDAFAVVLLYKDA